MKQRAIGIFDSGTGGLTVLGELRKLLPAENILYFADTGRLPYGEKDPETVRAYAEEITGFLISQGAELVVVASNTASAASLYHLREKFYPLAFVGMEPAVKPAARITKCGKVGVLATINTLQGELLQMTIKNHAEGIEVLLQPGTGLVEVVENADHAAAEQLLNQHLKPLTEAGVDVVVLGCTHYSWLKPMIAGLLGDRVEIVDPAPAVAKRAAELWNANTVTPGTGKTSFYCSGRPSDFEAQLIRLLNIESQVKKIDLAGLHLGR